MLGVPGASCNFRFGQVMQHVGRGLGVPSTPITRFAANPHV